MDNQLTTHPLVACVERIAEELKSVRDVPSVFLGPAGKKQVLLGLAGIEAQLAELKLRVVATADDVAAEDAARDVVDWLGKHTRCDRRPAKAEVDLAAALDQRWHKVAAGMADGAVSPAQAVVVVKALDALPDDLEPDVVAKAEAQLVGYCAQFTPAELRQLGKHLLDVIDPEAAENADAQRLQQEEQSARDKMRLTLTPRGDGTTRISGLLPDSAATRLRTYLEAYTSPRNPKNQKPGTGEADRIPYPKKLAQAFISLLEHLDPRTLPEHGGDATTLIVTITLDDLRNELGTASILDGSDPALGPNLSATEARRLACTAQIIPAVLGTHGEVLDLGRADRLYRPAQRRAIRLRDRQCRVKGCKHPASWCEIHHLKPWSEGGRTDLKDGIAICPWDHHKLHDPKYEHELLPDGDVIIRRKR